MDLPQQVEGMAEVGADILVVLVLFEGWVGVRLVGSEDWFEGWWP